MKITKFTLVALIILFFQGCTKDVDFNQLDDVNIHSTFIATLIYLNLTAPDFLDDSNKEIRVTNDFIELPISDDSKPYLEKIEFTVITENTFNRNFRLSITFYDEFRQPIYVLQPIINISESSPEMTTVIEIPKQDIPFIYDTEYFGFDIFFPISTDGSTIFINDDTSTFNLKSSAKLFFNHNEI
jgi:hypothetical protein